MHVGRLGEGHAAFAQQRHAGARIGRAEAEAGDPLVALGVEDARLRLDQLHVEAAARAARPHEHAALGHHAEALVVGQHGEAEQHRIERRPVLHAVVADVLDDAEPVHVGQRRRLLVDGGDGREVDVVDGELAVAVHEVDARTAHAVDRRDVEFHHLHVRGHGPGAEVEHVAIGRRRVAHAQRDGGDARRLVGPAVAVHRRRLAGVDDDVHLALAVQRHLARAVARDRPEAHHLEHLAEGLRPRRGVFDELDAVEADRVRGVGAEFAVECGGRHRGLLASRWRRW